MDTLSKEERSVRMRAVRRRGTQPEIAVRRAAKRAGVRFRCHVKNLPGTPDFVFFEADACVFVHGCFWHRHTGCRMASTPASRRAYWSKKFVANVARDRAKARALRAAGWRVFVIWECQTRNKIRLEGRIRRLAYAAST